MNKKLLEKMLNHTIKLYYKAMSDEMLFGNSYIEFGDRSLQVLDCSKVEQNIRTQKEDIYGKSPIESIQEEISFEDFCKEMLGVEFNEYQKNILKN